MSLSDKLCDVCGKEVLITEKGVIKDRFGTSWHNGKPVYLPSFFGHSNCGKSWWDYIAKKLYGKPCKRSQNF